MILLLKNREDYFLKNREDNYFSQLFFFKRVEFSLILHQVVPFDRIYKTNYVDR